MKNTKKNVSNQREAHHPSPAGEDRVRGIETRYFAYLYSPHPTLSIRRGLFALYA